jgi:hypothetical protein
VAEFGLWHRSQQAKNLEKLLLTTALSGELNVSRLSGMGFVLIQLKRLSTRIPKSGSLPKLSSIQGRKWRRLTTQKRDRPAVAACKMQRRDGPEPRRCRSIRGALRQGWNEPQSRDPAPNRRRPNRAETPARLKRRAGRMERLPGMRNFFGNPTVRTRAKARESGTRGK